MIKIYHNPRCRKSRETLNILRENDKNPQIIEYLKEVPSEKEITQILAILGLKPLDIIRKGETLFKEKYKGKNFEDQEWIKIIHDNPSLLERPIVVDGVRAVIGRPPENVNKLL